MIGMEIQLRNRLGRSQRHRQLQLCIPLVNLRGDSYRLKDRDLGRPTNAANDDQ
jgi:hypothetical protein